MMLYLWNMWSVVCPETRIATACCTPAFIIFRTADRRKSWKSNPSHPAAFVAFGHSLRRLVAGKASHQLSPGLSIETSSEESGRILAFPVFVCKAVNSILRPFKSTCPQKIPFASPGLVRLHDKGAAGDVVMLSACDANELIAAGWAVAV